MAVSAGPPSLCMRPLHGLNVLDLTWHVAGPYATKLLADYGADVLKVERPGAGDPARGYGPFPGDVPHPERSGAFLHLNTNKRAVTLNLKSETGRSILLEMVASADVLVESFSPRVMSSLGLGYDALAAVNPGLVMCSLSNFGQTGPYRDWKATGSVIHALAGLAVSAGIAEREPLKPADGLMEYQAGSMAATAIMGAALRQQWTGAGQHIDVAVYEVIASSVDRRMTGLLGYSYTGQIYTRAPLQDTALPFGSFPCKDGYVTFVVSPPARWTRFVEMLGHPELLDDPRLRQPTAWSDPAVKERIDGMFYPWLLERTKQEVMEAAQTARIAATAVNTPVDVLNDRHLLARRFWRAGEHPEAGTLPYAGPSFYMDGGGWDLKRTAPLLGQHNEEVYRGALGISPAELANLKAEGVV